MSYLFVYKNEKNIMIFKPLKHIWLYIETIHFDPDSLRDLARYGVHFTATMLTEYITSFVYAKPQTNKTSSHAYYS